jgi:hypothetical protein
MKFKNSEQDKLEKKSLCDVCDLFTPKHNCKGEKWSLLTPIGCKDCWTTKCKNCNHIWFL